MEQPRPRLDADFVQERWVRLYRPGPWRAMTLVGAVIACVLISTSASVIIASGRSLGERLVLLAVGILVAGGSLWLTGRGMASGVWVRDAGIRINTLRSSAILAWSDVKAVEQLDTALALVTADGRRIATGISARSLDFLARPEAYEIASTALSDWWLKHRA
ncbi:MAG: hypothetical protein WCJ42_10940 [Actinomycetes bacterium]